MADDKIVSAQDTAKTEKSAADKHAKDSKPAKKKGPGFGVKMSKFFRDSKGEFKKIIWPTKQTIIRNTLAVLAMCAVIGVIVTVFDTALAGLVKLLTSL